MKSFRKNSLVALFLAGIAFASSSESIDFSASSMRHEAAEGRELTVLSGNAYVRTGSKEIRADEIRLYGENYNILVCSGNVSIVDSEENMKIKSSTLFYDREGKILRINGRSETEDLKNEMIIKSGFMEYRQEEKILQLQIGVRILKENLTCRCEFATYDKESDMLLMTGLPVVYKDDDVFKATRITVLLENDEIRMDGEVKGSLTLDEKEETETEEIEEEKSGINTES